MIGASEEKSKVAVSFVANNQYVVLVFEKAQNRKKPENSEIEVSSSHLTSSSYGGTVI